MNILAEEQLKIFEMGISEAEQVLREREFNELYFKLRHKDENSFLGKLRLKIRKQLHKFVLPFYGIKNRLGGFSHEIISDRRTATNRPIIFAITHIGKYDIEIVSAAIKDDYYLLTGDYEHLQGTLDALFLAANGVIYFNQRVKSDRTLVSQRMIEHLQAGGNLMYFPEGTWNMTPNLPMLPCYWGIVEIAQKGNAIIVPIAIDQYGKYFKINIGENFDMLRFGNDPSEKANAIASLRDTMATLKWEIWETEKISRSEVCGDEWDKYIAARFQEWSYFNMDYIYRLIFKPKDITTYTDAFAHLQSIDPDKANAFLFNKRLK